MFREIKHCVPYGAPTFESYDIFSIIKNENEFERMIDVQIARLRKQNVDPDIIREYLNSLVDMYIASLNSKLEQKHLETNNYILNLCARRSTDEKEFMNLLEELDEQIESTEEEREVVKKLYEHFNPLKKGKLHLDGISLNKESEDE